MVSVDLSQQAKEEAERLCKLLADFNVSENKINMLMPVIEHTAFMKAKLDESKELIEKSKVVISYDNGGGQTGIRENPIFKGYESLWKSYMSGMTAILKELPEEEVKQKELEKPRNALEIVRARKNA